MSRSPVFPYSRPVDYRSSSFRTNPVYLSTDLLKIDPEQVLLKIEHVPVYLSTAPGSKIEGSRWYIKVFSGFENTPRKVFRNPR